MDDLRQLLFSGITNFIGYLLFVLSFGLIQAIFWMERIGGWKRELASWAFALLVVLVYAAGVRKLSRRLFPD